MYWGPFNYWLWCILSIIYHTTRKYIAIHPEALQTLNSKIGIILQIYLTNDLMDLTFSPSCAWANCHACPQKFMPKCISISGEGKQITKHLDLDKKVEHRKSNKFLYWK